MGQMKHIVTVVALLAISVVGWAFPWNQDMVDQPVAKPHRGQAPAGPGSIPIEGGETLPAPTTEQGMFDAKDDAAVIPNPEAATPESIVQGENLYQINCLVCHGAGGLGDGPVGQLLAVAPVDLNDAYTQDQADGQIFFTLTRGRGTMPYYRDALSHEERWHVINYLRSEFGSE